MRADRRSDNVAAVDDTALTLVSSSEGVLAILVAVAAFWFFVAETTRAKLFDFLPPLLFIYATPVLLSNLALGGSTILPTASPVYDVMRTFGLPIFITLMLVGVDVGAAVRVMGRGVLVMLLGTLGIVVGAPLAYLVVNGWLAPDAWKGFGALAGSWIGGTGNMAATAGALETPGEQLGLAVLADQVVYLVWLPILLGSKAFADRFNRWARVPADRLERMEAAAASEKREKRPARMTDYLFLGAIAAAVTWIASALAPALPVLELGGETVVSTSTWKVLLVTSCGLLLSLTPVRKLPGAHDLAMAIVYVFVAVMGARASLDGLDQAPAFLVGAFIWIFIHGAFCVAGAKLLRVDLHSAAIASAANIGGAASAPVVAAAHRESLVPVSILMALLGYAVGNYAAILTGHLCRIAGGS